MERAVYVPPCDAMKVRCHAMVVQNSETAALAELCCAVGAGMPSTSRASRSA